MDRQVAIFKRNHENLFAEVFAWHDANQSGGIGYKKTCDWRNPPGSMVKHTPTPKDFPKYLKVYARSLFSLHVAYSHLYNVLEQKYCNVSHNQKSPITDELRAVCLDVSPSEFSKRLSKAWECLYLAYPIAKMTVDNMKEEMV